MSGCPLSPASTRRLRGALLIAGQFSGAGSAVVGALALFAVVGIIGLILFVLQRFGLFVPRGYGRDQAQERALEAWRENAEASAAAAERSATEVKRLEAVVSRLSTEVSELHTRIDELMRERARLLSKPDYDVLLERFAAVEESIGTQMELVGHLLEVMTAVHRLVSTPD